MKRAQGPTSNFRAFAKLLGEPRRIDAHTVAFTTEVPNPVLVETVSGIMIMSWEWCRKHKVETDPARRQSLINDAVLRIRDNVYYIPLHRRIAPWVSRANVEAARRANNHVHAISVTVR